LRDNIANTGLQAFVTRVNDEDFSINTQD